MFILSGALCMASLGCNLSLAVPDSVPARPSVVFVAPEKDSRIAEGATIQLAARAEDPLGIGIARIDFAVDGLALGSQPAPEGTPPQTFLALQIWGALKPGKHQLTVSAFRADKDATLIQTVDSVVEVVPAASLSPATLPASASATPLLVVSPTDSPTRIVPTTLTPTSPATQAATAPVTPPIASVPQAKVITAFLNVRTGPGTNYDSVGQVKAGDILQVLGRNDDLKWIAIQGPNGTLRGWIVNNPTFISITGDMGTVPLAAAKPSPTVKP